MKAEMDWVRIERVLEAPIERVWDMWTDPALFAQWYGPNGMTIPIAEMDVAVGGRRKICMKMEMPDRTMTMWFTGPTASSIRKACAMRRGTSWRRKAWECPKGTRRSPKSSSNCRMPAAKPG